VGGLLYHGRHASIAWNVILVQINSVGLVMTAYGILTDVVVSHF